MSGREEDLVCRKDNYSTSSADFEYASENEVEEQTILGNLPGTVRNTTFKAASRERSDGSEVLSSSPESPVTTETQELQELQKQRGEMSPKAAQEEILAQIQRLQLKLTELREVDNTSSVGSHHSQLNTSSSGHSLHRQNLESSVRDTICQQSETGETLISTNSAKVGPKLLVVSNRLPVTVTKDNNGAYHFNMSSGGLVSALKGVKSLMPFLWIGWPGTEIDPNERDYVRNKLREGYSCFPVFITDEQANLYYNGFCNDVLWPLFHYVPLPIVSSDGERKFDFKYWQAYSAANYRFAEAVLQVYQEGDYIWVQDYHLLLLPSLLRRRLRDVKIGFFLHIPFPTSEVYRIIPVRKELLQGVLAADLIGFHTYDYARHFLSVCTRILGLDSSPKGVNYHSHFAHVGIFPIGIDPNTFHRALEDANVQQRIQELHERFMGKKVLLGVDRLDYIKGVPHKLLALEWLLTKYSEWMHKVVLVQIAVPTRTEIEEYKKLSSQTNELVGRINGKFGTVDHSPIMFINQSLAFEELVALYTVADVAIVSSVRDGMNLVSYEYVMCQQANKGVLILSEFAGSAQSLSGAIRVNPWNVEELANAIHEALSMPRREREIKHWKLYRYVWLEVFEFVFLMIYVSSYVTTHTAEYWAKSFFQELDNVVKHRDELRLSLPLLNVKSVIKRISIARTRLFLLEYEGTCIIRLFVLVLCHPKSLAELNSPTSTHIKILTRLCSDPRNIIVVISGRSKTILDNWFG
ncbi:alpha,alpha-trehalose-phosphate synthase (UDP-forming) isoform 2 [Galdieria sulphuraria]|uniref:alpha,alpha-trehalose-phosphate synthase (UDP-forming) n=1 Tax=Galdieria sulphuraria TaxID=130081 RepID=M2XRH8_GALSU|nr:alpha,alpha-trehalose-phosphate synthase (UDP-forming) isoform 2 [Galdieria sulphuraria]EME32832.1 alpha,alpha-trehalose-phosphate synthase (UDP-forming) isoform 2 [Galdieria sulphuraria]|eukprot:XP_005709352.1 alpha,alpha-trehalose-phosphate synthase (UDP-forming) isoform 2 [Galdieria sulphuraria]